MAREGRKKIRCMGKARVLKQEYPWQLGNWKTNKWLANDDLICLKPLVNVA